MGEQRGSLENLERREDQMTGPRDDKQLAELSDSSDVKPYDYAVIGGGIVGLSHCHASGRAISRGSHRNAGKGRRACAPPERPKLRRHSLRHLLQAGQLQGPFCQSGREFDGRVLSRARDSARDLRQGDRGCPGAGTARAGQPLPTRPAKWFAGPENLAAGGQRNRTACPLSGWDPCSRPPASLTTARSRGSISNCSSKRVVRRSSETRSGRSRTAAEHT